MLPDDEMGGLDTHVDMECNVPHPHTKSGAVASSHFILVHHSA